MSPRRERSGAGAPIRRWPLHALALGLALVALAPAGVRAVTPATPRELQPEQSFSGTLPLATPPLLPSPIVSRAELQRAWTLCSVKTPMPAIDFGRRLVLVAVAQSSKVSFVKLTLVAGDLKTTVAIAPDMPNHRTCTLAVVDRAGIKKVNGVAVGA